MTDRDHGGADGLTAEELAHRVQRGSKASFTELVKRFGPRLYRYFQRRIRSREDCEDLVQETLVKAYRNIQRYRRGESFATWLFTIGTRLSVDFVRARERSAAKMSRIPVDRFDVGDPLEAAAQEDERSDLWASAKALPGKQFDALWLRYGEDMEVREIARVLGITRAHVKVLLYRARGRLSRMRGTGAGVPRASPGKGKSVHPVFSYERGGAR